MPFTTGWITNTRDFGTAATNIVVNLKNADQANGATIILEILGSPDGSSFAPIYAQSVILAPNSNQALVFFIAGNVSYEVQYEVIVSQSNNVVITVFGINEFGNLVTNQRYVPSEFTFIDQLSPLA
ncbi:hypothetical protein GZH47_02420 [Paenibacillus rhizovicinus]|uniref:Exosporium protein C n=1 Tax=Paenibacillus rhizovicinus TaxID=2704463 RepID=A0A6C0NVP2_9BACL|nr:hypothetical protein [Paenibacillus rhizovicinus]QHW29803.1 hypothetical protein GZH47_02420 [Paenibacillus rhizovicinus]